MRNSLTRLGNITIVGLKSIARNKMRSLLTALGVVIGVACVIVSVAIGAGVAQSVSEMINSLGSNYIMVMPGASTQGGARIFTGSSNLTEEDAEAIRREAPAVAYVSPQNRTAGQVVGLIVPRTGADGRRRDQVETYAACGVGGREVPRQNLESGLRSRIWLAPEGHEAVDRSSRDHARPAWGIQQMREHGVVVKHVSTLPGGDSTEVLVSIR